MKSLCRSVSGLILVGLMLGSLPVVAQGSNPEMADALRQDGKIWVVVLSLLVILIGMVGYLFRTESRLQNLEKKLNQHEN
jgi:succinate dehydrogenase hydrophobic anchor subunit